MKITTATASRNAAFTLVEMLVGAGIFLVTLVGVMVGLQIFGLRVYTLSATKLTATEDARQALNTLRGQIRSAKNVYVGTYNDGEFSRISNGLPQIGNALQIQFADSTNAAVVYYCQPTGPANGLYRLTNNISTLVAGYVTNYYMFTAEDYQAQTLVTYDNNPVIRVTMLFYQWQYPIGYVGSEGLNAYNHYRLQTRISRRAKE